MRILFAMSSDETRLSIETERRENEYLIEYLGHVAKTLPAQKQKKNCIKLGAIPNPSSKAALI